MPCPVNYMLKVSIINMNVVIYGSIDMLMICVTYKD